MSRFSGELRSAATGYQNYCEEKWGENKFRKDLVYVIMIGQH
jgi:hypothetical protein